MITQLKSVFLHLSGNCDLTVDQTLQKAYTIGQDLVLKQISFDSNGTFQSKDYGCDDEFFSININPLNPRQIVLGGPEKEPAIYDIGDSQIENPRILANLLGATYQVAFSPDGKLVGIGSNDTIPIIYSMEQSRTFKCRPGHSASVLSISFSHDSQYFASTSTDGTLHVYSVSKALRDSEDSKLIGTTISKEVKKLEGGNVLKHSWHPKEYILAIPGAMFLSIYDGLTNSISSAKEFSHNDEISITKFISSDILLTASVDKEIKVWNFKTKRLIISHKTLSPLQSLDAIIDANIILGMDWEGQLHYFGIEGVSPQEEETLINEINEDKVLVVKKLEQEEIPDSKAIPHENNAVRGQKRLADLMITSLPQSLCQSGSTDFLSARRFLQWNLVGSITQRKENEYTFIDIEFADKNFHQNIILPDMLDYQFGKLNYMGAVLASKSPVINEDNYLDEEEENTQAIVHFIPFVTYFDSREWKIPLENENIEEICIGASWIAVATSSASLLIFNFAGNLVDSCCFNGELVAMAGYENLLAYVNHGGLPFKGQQLLILTVYNVESHEIIAQIPLPLASFTILTWFGFSEEGMLIIQDSNNKTRALIGNRWLALSSTLSNKFWIVGSCDYELIGVLMGENDFEPKSFPKPHLKSLKITFPIFSNFEKDAYEALYRSRIILEHERVRSTLWGAERILRKNGNPLMRYSDSVLSTEELEKKEQEIEKKALEIFNQLLVKGEHERAWIFANSQFKVLKTWEISIVFCGKLKLNKLADKLKESLRVVNLLYQGI